MAESSISLNAGSGGSDVATMTDGGGLHHQKIVLELDSGTTPVPIDNANPLPVSDAGGSITVDNAGTFAVQATLQASTNTQEVVGDAAHDAVAAGNPLLMGAYASSTAPTDVSANGDAVRLWADLAGRLQVGDGGGSVTVDNGGTFAVQAAQSGTWNVGTVTTVSTVSAVSAVTPGTGASNLGKAEDAAHSSGDVGVMALSVRQDTAAALAGTDADYQPLITDASGRLHVNVGNTVTVGSHNVTNAGTFAVQASQSGTWTVQPGNTANTTAWLVTGTGGTFPATQSGTWTVQPGNTANTTPWLVAGQAAHDAVVSGNPVRVAGRARTSAYTSVASDDVADLVTTLDGKQIVQAFSIPELTWSYAAASGGITNTTGVTAKAAAGAGVRNYITRVQVVNGHATVSTDVQIRDGASGTVLWRGFAQAAGGGVSAVFDPPLRGSANTLVEVACGTTGSATYFNLQGYTGP